MMKPPSVAGSRGIVDDTGTPHYLNLSWSVF